MEINDYVLLDFLGEGKFGNVYKARTKTNSDRSYQKVAIKIMDKSYLMKERLYNNALNEIEILKRVNHKHIVKFIESIETDSNIYIIMDYYKGGELFDRLNEAGDFDEFIVARYIYQVSLAVDYLHKNNIIHRDIKPENIILTRNNEVKLCDFGWSVFSNYNYELTQKCGTLEYFSPEVVLGRKQDYRVDLWSIGVLTFELLTGSSPFFSATLEDTYIKILNLDVTYPEYITESAKNFISRFLVIDPHRRMELYQIQYHPWMVETGTFNGVNPNINSVTSGLNHLMIN